MKHQKKWLLIFIALGMLVLACGLGDQAAETGKEQAETAAKEVEQQADTTAKEAAEEAEEAAASAAAEAAKEAEETAAAVAAEAAKEAEEAAKEAEEAAAEAAKDEAEGEKEAAEKAEEKSEEKAETTEESAGEGEVTALKSQSIEATLQSYDSYRWQFHLEFDGVDKEDQPQQGEIDVLIEAIKEPAAMHMSLNVQGQPADDLGGAALIEMYVQDEMAYLQNPEDGSWFSFPAEDIMADIFNEGFFNPDEIVDLPEEARCSVLDEPVNGIPVRRCVFDEADISDENFTAESAKGELYLAQEGDYPVKLDMEMTGSSADGGEDFFTSGTMRISYELLDINQPFEIELPAEALEAQGFGDLMSGQVDPANVEWPMMADAEIDFSMEGLVSYTTASSISEVVEFYQTELPNDGWTYDAEAEYISDESALLSFSKDGTELSLVIGLEDDGSISVLLSTNP